MSLLLWILALTAILLAVRGAAGPLTGWKSVKLLLLPGLLVAVVSRSIACGLTGTQLKAVNLPWRKGEPVEHGDSKVPILGAAILALLPFLAGTGTVLGVRSWLAPEVRCEEELPMLGANIEAIGELLGTGWRLLVHAFGIIREADLEALRLWGFLYLALAVLLFAAPTWKEWKALAACLAAMFAIVASVEWLGLRAGWFSRGWFISGRYGGSAFEALALLVMMGLIVLAAVAAFRGSIAFGKAAFGGKKEKDGED